MIHMLSRFDVADAEQFETVEAEYRKFIAELIDAGLVEEAGPISFRVDDTPMDADPASPQRYFSLMSFRDREQLDAAYAHIAARKEPAASTHAGMYGRMRNAAFLCFSDTLPGRSGS